LHAGAGIISLTKEDRQTGASECPLPGAEQVEMRCEAHRFSLGESHSYAHRHYKLYFL